MKLLILILALVIHGEAETWSLVGNPLLAAHPCNGTDDITVHFEPGLPPDEENQYHVYIGKQVPISTTVEMVFDSEATVVLNDFTASNARIATHGDVFIMRFFRKASSIGFTVKGPDSGTVPYFKSLKINKHEYCAHPRLGYLDDFIYGVKDTAAVHLKAPEGCGRRKIQHTELIVNGEATKPGDWPWHVAIYRQDRSQIKYICGGTLISKTMVLTAAHCATIRGVSVIPEILSVVLGKYNLIGGDLETQEREVQSVIVHEDFSTANYLDNDIALIKLKTEASYSNYVQPACIWYNQAMERLPSDKILGTVVGWGFDLTDSLSAQLRQATMPKISDANCIKKNPIFYGKALGNNRKFCAGWDNGTSACNGDSGGGFTVFVPDTAKDNSPNAIGSWYVRGIVSMSLSRKDVALCDPQEYAVFTDVAIYAEWIQNQLRS